MGGPPEAESRIISWGISSRTCRPTAERGKGSSFGRTYNELEELLRRARDIFPPTDAVWHEQAKTWTWPNGATLKMRYMERDADATRYQGHQYSWIGWDELTQWPSDYGYRYLRARLTIRA